MWFQDPAASQLASVCAKKRHGEPRWCRAKKKKSRMLVALLWQLSIRALVHTARAHSHRTCTWLDPHVHALLFWAVCLLVRVFTSSPRLVDPFLGVGGGGLYWPFSHESVLDNWFVLSATVHIVARFCHLIVPSLVLFESWVHKLAFQKYACCHTKGPSPITGILFQTNDVRLSWTPPPLPQTNTYIACIWKNADQKMQVLPTWCETHGV